jgi:hypothetical protein
MKRVTSWTGWAITKQGAIVIYDARLPIYWKRYIARRVAEEHGLCGYSIVKVKVVKANP